jgi:TRAP-type C4-dicarboxylate transport system substrate-binding protein
MKKLAIFTIGVLFGFISVFGNHPGKVMAADQKPLKLKANYFAPETIPPGLGMAAGSKQIEEKTGGKIKITNYFSGTLVSYTDEFSAVSKGIIDIALVEAGQITQVCNLNKVFSMPLQKTPPDQVGLTKSYRELIKAVPELNGELGKMNIRWISAMSLPGYNYHGVKKAVRTPDDIKGMKVEALGEGVPYLTAMGAAPISLDPGDYYMSLERGLVEAQFTHWAVLGVFKTEELVKYHTFFGEGEGGLYGPVLGFIINTKTWSKLTPETQEIFEAGYNFACDHMRILDEPLIAASKKLIKDRGDVIIHLSDKEREPWAAYMEPVVSKWAAECKAKGLPGQATYDKLMELIEKNRKAQ